MRIGKLNTYTTFKSNERNEHYTIGSAIIDGVPYSERRTIVDKKTGTIVSTTLFANGNTRGRETTISQNGQVRRETNRRQITPEEQEELDVARQAVRLFREATDTDEE